MALSKLLVKHVMMQIGEAYDKVGRVLGLPYPSGKEIDALAHEGTDTYQFPRAMLKRG